MRVAGRTGRGLRHVGRIAPKAQRAHRVGNLNRASLPRIHLEHCSGQSVFRLPSVRGRTEPWVAPRSSPGPGRACVERVERCVVTRLLVANERPIRCCAAVDARFPPSLPKNLVAAHEYQIDAGSARRLHIGPRRRVPILVMPGRHEDFMWRQQSRGPRSIDFGAVRDVVAILLQPIYRGEFGAEKKVLRTAVCPDAVARGERPVIT